MSLFLCLLLLAAAPSESSPAPADTVLVKPKRPETALLLSAGGTVVPVLIGSVLQQNSEADEAGSTAGAVLVLSGLVVGPALGHLYAGNGGRATQGTLIRGITVAVASVGVVILAIDVLEHLGGAEEGSGQAGTVGAGLLLGGTAVLVGSIVLDVIHAPGSARQWNKRHGLAQLRVTPVYVPGDAVGLALRARL